MSLHFQRELERLHREVLTQAGRVEKMIYDAVSALCDRRYELVQSVILQDDIVDKQDVELEEECLKLLALHQPVARDLRRITTVLKLNADLEIIADLACNIAERAAAIQAFPFFPTPDELSPMADNATLMLRMALDAFVNSDTSIAAKVIQYEAEVDEQNREIIVELQSLVEQDSSLVEPAFLVFSAARHIEQVADLAAGVAEEVIYMIDGEIVRHKQAQYIRKTHG